MFADETGIEEESGADLSMTGALIEGLADD